VLPSLRTFSGEVGPVRRRKCVPKSWSRFRVSGSRASLRPAANKGGALSRSRQRP
jgi:hypothetical protein